MPESAENLLGVRGLEVTLGHGARAAQVLKGVDLSVRRGTVVALVGESGSGKSTIAKTILGIHPFQKGRVVFDGRPVDRLTRRQRHEVRRRVQLIPQDPFSSLDPRRTIGQTLAEAIDPLRARVRTHHSQIGDVLAAVALDARAMDSYPHQLSGGQRQRVAIARALLTDPDLIIADEITSALDVSTQAEILTLLARLRKERGLTVLFISHNLAVVHQVSDDIVVLCDGRVMESGPVSDVFARPASDYTRQLIAAVPGGPAFSLDPLSTTGRSAP